MSNRWPVLRVRVALLLAITLAGLASCKKKPPQANPVGADAWRARLEAAAETVTFTATENAVDVQRAGAPPPPPLTFAVAVRQGVGGAWVAARIRSATDYTPLGVAAGDNYLWVRPAGDSVELALVPADSTKPAYLLEAKRHEARAPDTLVVSTENVRSRCWTNSPYGFILRLVPGDSADASPRPPGTRSATSPWIAVGCTCSGGTWYGNGQPTRELTSELAAPLLQALGG